MPSNPNSENPIQREPVTFTPRLPTTEAPQTPQEEIIRKKESHFDRKTARQLVGLSARSLIFIVTGNVDEQSVKALIKIQKEKSHEAITMRQAEVRIAAELSGKTGFARVYEYTLGEKPEIIVEYFAGQTLVEERQHRELDKKPISLAEIENVVFSIGSALQSMHDLGVVHRDVKLGNILVEEKGNLTARVALTDFDMSTAVFPVEKGMSVGTPHYMSKRAQLGELPDYTVDLYAFACVLYELFSGGALPYGEPQLALKNLLGRVDPATIFLSAALFAQSEKFYIPLDPQTNDLDGIIFMKRLNSLLDKALMTDESAEKFASVREFANEVLKLLGSKRQILENEPES